MKPSTWEKQLGLASPRKYAAIQRGKTKNPSKKETGLDASYNTRVSLEGRENNFFLDILFHRMSASATSGTLKVDVSRIGVSISPNSFTCVGPTSLPNALPTKTAPGTFSRNRLPGCGRMAVTPVCTSLSRTMVVCPTSTPATSVIASSSPVGKMPTLSPKTTARGRTLGVVFCATAVVASTTAMAAASFLLVITEPNYICGS